jgi:integrase
LSAAALDVLKRAMPKGGTPKPSDFIFPSRGHAAGCFDPGSALDLLRALRPDAVDAESGKPVTTHGFRTSFFAWAMETTDYSDRLVNSALAHTIKDKVERAYNRSTLVEKRAVLMRDWAGYATSLCVEVANADDALAQAA